MAKHSMLIQAAHKTLTNLYRERDRLRTLARALDDPGVVRRWQPAARHEHLQTARRDADVAEQ